MKKTSLAVVTILLSILLLSCGKVSSPDSSRVTVRSAGRLHSAVADTSYSSADVKRVRVTVTGAGMDEMVVSADYSSSGFEIRMDVPNGRLRHFSVAGLDADGITIYLGTANADLSGEPVTLAVDMYSVDAYPPVFDGATGASAVSSTEIKLSWNAASDDMTNTENIVYLIYKATVSGGQNYAEPEYTTEPGVTSFAVTGLTEGVTYYFVVRAKDADGKTDTNTKEVSAATNSPAVADWLKTYGTNGMGMTVGTDTFENVRATSDGGYIAVGYTENIDSRLTAAKKPKHASATVTTYGLVVKTLPSGDLDWQKRFGSDLGDSYFHSVEQTSDKGYIIVGETLATGAGYNDGWIVKLKENGDTDWQQTFRRAGKDNSLRAAFQIGDNYVAIGYTNNTSKEFWLVTMNSEGTPTKQIEAGDWDKEELLAAIITSDGGFVLAGSTDSLFENTDGFIAKFDALGQSSWNRVLGGNNTDYLNSVTELEGGDIVAAGYSDSFGNDSINVWVVKLGGNKGDVTWAHAFGGTDDDLAYGVCPSGNGGVVVAGYTTSSSLNGWLLKLDENGNVNWQYSYSTGIEDKFYSVVPTGNGFTVAGTSAASFGSNQTDYDGLIMQVDSAGDFAGACITKTGNNDLGSIISSSANSRDLDASISVTVTDITNSITTGDGFPHESSMLGITNQCTVQP